MTRWMHPQAFHFPTSWRWRDSGGWRFVSGGVARASLNHRLIAFMPPAWGKASGFGGRSPVLGRSSFRCGSVDPGGIPAISPGSRQRTPGPDAPYHPIPEGSQRARDCWHPSGMRDFFVRSVPVVSSPAGAGVPQPPANRCQASSLGEKSGLDLRPLTSDL